ncbi:MAG TPA: ABC transporter permease [Thermodesulfobacteriota bacterium]|nr:ABC transporter permease [Thermodesulfobacteriota bacterium]
MPAFLLKRILLLIPSLIGVTVMVFVISHVVPADPVGIALGPEATQEQINAMREAWGLNQPLYVQYGIFLRNLVQGNLGYSLVSKRAVTEELGYYFPATFELTTASMILSILLGIFIGIVSAVYRNRLFDHLTRTYCVFGISMPVFWLGLLLLLLFYVKLGWLPGGGRIADGIQVERISGFLILDSLLTGNWEALGSALLHLVLPAFCLSSSFLATISRIARSSVLQVIREDYVRTARAKGVPEFLVMSKHVLRNSILPVITISGILYGQLLGGAVLTETIFSWPGMGRYVVRSILHLDFEPILGFTVLVAILYALANLMVDLLYSVVNPQIRLE